VQARLDGVQARLDSVQAHLDSLQAHLDSVQARLLHFVKCASMSARSVHHYEWSRERPVKSFYTACRVLSTDNQVCSAARRQTCRSLASLGMTYGQLSTIERMKPS
jgi:hypothetical protein